MWGGLHTWDQREEIDTSNGQGFADKVNLLHRLKWKRQLLSGIIRDTEEQDYAYHQVSDGEQPEGRTPSEELGGDTRENGAEDETKRIAGAEAGEGQVFPLVKLLVDSAGNALTGRHSGRAHDAHETIQYVYCDSIKRYACTA